MKIKRFFAKDMRAALAQVKDTLGSDAVIMSNKKVNGGIEIVAAVDYDEPKAKASAAAPTFMDVSDDLVSLGGKAPIRAETKLKPSAPADSLQALLEKQQNRLNQQLTHQQQDAELPAWAKGLQAPAAAKAERRDIANSFDKKPQTSQKQNADLEAMRDELASLRNLLTHQVSALMTEHKKRIDPVGAMLESKLLEAEFSPAVASKLAALSQHYTPAELVRALPQSLANMLDNQGDDIVKQGGVVALVGPTGVGKTTSLAKLAARFAAHHGADQVALITTDHYRIGAYEQLATYGKIMGCPVKQAHDLAELEQILYQFRNRKLVLIDTAGMGQRDMRLYQQLDNLTANSRIPIRSYLVLSATGQRRVLQDAVNHFKRIPLSGVVLTKLDESVSLAGALSVLIQSGLPLSYVTDGQRVPEDMKVADTLMLAEQALAALENTEQQSLPDTAWSDNMTCAFE
ncbi:flagellar biosynthesis protein FlhF [Shewanella oneidensis MR-1]|uniref:Flagellar biosynthesis protein FlhF n=1 Tax=Shewanella oneidensis (strain ATCC 700550 / JCM 31522 / CIP 106686 / LMG 19005 / NCIMB 14063 / MR-1) TaxID=211586 RepID=Q8ECD1_SHEON|nr:flagellar biosynthesis protein FlhF [Shewanella oneidensis]AAN56211.1 flagellar polar localization control system flagellar assembly determinant GTPase FlhF [Shewanella oneidensis MR-1]MDX5999357.1 flagellar biosynthesis protein FlhF [Shewanella oneidensis]MEE2026405.1 Signal recognition particle receptor FtsY [Shewanella oneidensis]QKG97636.1 flagellar biosynthesis protein FlhF [Shewanella oneidensis MR-1]